MRVATKQGATATPSVAAHGSIRSHCFQSLCKGRKYIGKLHINWKNYNLPMHAQWDTVVSLPYIEDSMISSTLYRHPRHGAHTFAARMHHQNVI